MPRVGVWPESVLYDQSGSGGSIVGRSFEIGNIVKYAGLNSDQLDLIFGKNLARLLRIEPKPSDPKTMDITQI